MSEQPRQAATPSRLRQAAQWAALIASSAACAGALGAVGLPAALLLGPMIAGIACAYHGATIDIPRPVTAVAQGLLGCMIAHNLPLSITTELVKDWPLFVIGVASVIVASALLGLALTRLRVLPGTTVLWGLSPGAASAMTLLAESFGADIRLVAFMQYSRVLLVAGIASMIAVTVGAGAGHPASAASWFPPIDWLPFAGTLAIAIIGPFVAIGLGFRSGAMLLPLALAAVLAHLGLIEIVLPRWLLAIAYACLGWRIGLRFTRALFLHALKALPVIAACSLALIAVCGALAGGFALFAGIDPLTAYLATSPGGVDSVAIIAASTSVDVPFVMTMQMLRLFVVMLTGPALARYIARRSLPAA